MLCGAEHESLLSAVSQHFVIVFVLCSLMPVLSPLLDIVI